MRGEYVLTLLLCACAARADPFTFVSAERVAPISVAAGEPEFVRLAAEDLASDVLKVTGKRPEVVQSDTVPVGACVVICTKEGGAWESCRVEAKDGRLVIEGGDARGTMFGVYAFLEQYLHVDPLYFWSGREPEKRTELSWHSVSLVSGSPTFKFRGWFINDEDLLTFWKPNGKKRELPYKFYNNMMSPEALQAVAEAMVRSRFNLVIPASFIDVLNPEEEALVRECARRGLYVSMHHQEPLGVSAWAYFNYWKARGRDLKYSYVSQPEEVREVWRVYAKKWSAYPNVVWQLGLRGKGDRPMWQADANTPQSDAERGRIISEAMAAQVKILDEVCPQQTRFMSTTLWAEGAVLNQKGLLAIPEGTIVVFADNSPGWKWQQDFYETAHNAKNTYGVYYHHALIGCGPHLAQAVPPDKTFELLQQAVRIGAADYVIFNVSNVREFVLGIDASAKMTWRMHGFEPETWLDAWVKERFSSMRDEVAEGYRLFFNAYQIHDLQKVPFMLDGQITAKGLHSLQQLAERVKAHRTGLGRSKEEKGVSQAERVKPAAGDAFWASLSDTSPPALGRREAIKRAAMQKAGFEVALSHAYAAAAKLPAGEAAFLRDNLIFPGELMAGLSTWLERLLVAGEALDADNLPGCVLALKEAETALVTVQAQAEAYCHDQWKTWYRGCVILDLSARLKQTRDVLIQVNALGPLPSGVPNPPETGVK